MFDDVGAVWHGRVLVVDDEMGTPTAQGRAVDALAAALRSSHVEVVGARTADEGLVTVGADTGLKAILVDIELQDDTAGGGAARILEAVRARNATVPIFLTADRARASKVARHVMEMADEFVWMLEDTPDFIAGRVLAAIRRDESRAGSAANAAAQALTILVVDDALAQPDSTRGARAAALVSSLRQAGAVVVEALSADDGRASVTASAGWHAIVVDATLSDVPHAAPEVAALELLRYVRERNTRVPVVLTTDRAAPPVVTSEMATLADEFVWLLEDTPSVMAGRVLAAAARYVNHLLPPFAKALLAYGEDHEYSWAAPGHQGGVAFTKSPVGRVLFDFYGEALFRTDMGIERASLGSLLSHTGPIGESERYAARVFGAHRTYAAQNGSSGANRTILTACVGEGEIALVDRNCHKSIEQGLALSGGVPVYLRPTRNRYGIIGPVHPASMEAEAMARSIDAHPLLAHQAARHASLSAPAYAVITNCTYDGLCYDAARIEAMLGASVDRLHFDEAWYGYARFHPLYRDRFAMRGDPDAHGAQAPTVFANQSTHKLLAALSQAAFIHVRDGRRPIEHARFNEAYAMQASTSPLYPLLASNDVAAAMMDGAGGYVLVRDALMEAIACRQTLASLQREFAGRGEWFFAPWNAPDVVDPGHQRTIAFADASLEWLASVSDAWTLRSGDTWHGFGDLPDGWCMLDPTKLGVVCPGVGADGALAARGVPADLVTAYLTARGIVPSRTTDHMVLFLFTIGVTKGKWGTLVHALLDFKRDFDRNARLDGVLPALVASAPERYGALGLRDLADEMFAHLAHSRQGYWQSRACAELPRPVLTPRQAFSRLMAGDVDLLPLDQLAGRVSGVGIIPYPPGIPLVMPGEAFGAATDPWLSYLRALEAWSLRFPGFGREVEGLQVRDGRYWGFGGR